MRRRETAVCNTVLYSTISCFFLDIFAIKLRIFLQFGLNFDVLRRQISSGRAAKFLPKYNPGYRRTFCVKFSDNQPRLGGEKKEINQRQQQIRTD